VKSSEFVHLDLSFVIIDQLAVDFHLLTLILFTLISLISNIKTTLKRSVARKKPSSVFCVLHIYYVLLARSYIKQHKDTVRFVQILMVLSAVPNSVCNLTSDNQNRTTTNITLSEDLRKDKKLVKNSENSPFYDFV